MDHKERKNDKIFHEIKLSMGEERKGRKKEDLLHSREERKSACPLRQTAGNSGFQGRCKKKGERSSFGKRSLGKTKNVERIKGEGLSDDRASHYKKNRKSKKKRGPVEKTESQTKRTLAVCQTAKESKKNGAIKEKKKHERVWRVLPINRKRESAR